jgi:hypothetical protein
MPQAQQRPGVLNPRPLPYNLDRVISTASNQWRFSCYHTMMRHSKPARRAMRGRSDA